MAQPTIPEQRYFVDFWLRAINSLEMPDAVVGDQFDLLYRLYHRAWARTPDLELTDDQSAEIQDAFASLELFLESWWIEIFLCNRQYFQLLQMRL